MILVADSGSTNTNWCLLEPGGEISYFDTEGYNPYFVSSSYMFESLSKQLPGHFPAGDIGSVFFYGAGCFEDKALIIQQALHQAFVNAEISIGLDLLGSARSVLGDQPGFLAILGTGTNSCLYDGKQIKANIDSLGYLLGDEGSGYYIGRKLLGDYIRESMPEIIRDAFYQRYGLGREAIMDQIYSEKLPNRFCAGFTKFISENISGSDYLRMLVKRAFLDFFDGLVTKYENYQDFSFNCTGSVGHAFKDILIETALEFRMQPGVILKAPIQGLAQYHLSAGYR